jgi:hypothetical protein
MFRFRDEFIAIVKKNIPFAEGFFATTAYAATLLCGTVL